MRRGPLRLPPNAEAPTFCLAMMLGAYRSGTAASSQRSCSGIPMGDRRVGGQVVVLGELAEDACRLVRLLQRICVREDPLGVDADDAALAEAVACLPGDARSRSRSSARRDRARSAGAPGHTECGRRGQASTCRAWRELLGSSFGEAETFAAPRAGDQGSRRPVRGGSPPAQVRLAPLGGPRAEAACGVARRRCPGLECRHEVLDSPLRFRQDPGDGVLDAT